MQPARSLLGDFPRVSETNPAIPVLRRRLVSLAVGLVLCGGALSSGTLNSQGPSWLR